MQKHASLCEQVLLGALSCGTVTYVPLGVGVAEETARVVPAVVSLVVRVPLRRGENAEFGIHAR